MCIRDSLYAAYVQNGECETSAQLMTNRAFLQDPLEALVTVSYTHLDVYKRQVVVIGDGAVGQCAVIAAKMRGASQIVLMSRHQDRQKMALESGATAVVAERGQEGIAKVREILGGGADAALECVGTEAAVDQALGVLHNGGRMGFVGVPHYNNRALGSTLDVYKRQIQKEYLMVIWN